MLARRVAGFLRTVKGTTGVFLVVYSDPAAGPDTLHRAVAPEPAAPPSSALVVALAGELEACGIEVQDAWHVGGGRWRSYLCADPSCCPPEGKPLDGIELSETNLHLVLAGSNPRGTEPGVPELDAEAEPWADHDSVRAAVAAVLDGADPPRRTALLMGWCRFLDGGGGHARDIPDLLRRLRADPRETGALLAALHDKAIRDCLPSAAGLSAADGVAALSAIERGGERKRCVRRMADFMLGVCPGDPGLGPLGPVAGAVRRAASGRPGRGPLRPALPGCLGGMGPGPGHRRRGAAGHVRGGMSRLPAGDPAAPAGRLRPHA